MATSRTVCIAAAGCAAWAGLAYLIHRKLAPSKGYSGVVVGAQKLLGFGHMPSSPLAIPLILPALREQLVKVVEGGVLGTATMLSPAFAAVSFCFGGTTWWAIGYVVDAWRLGSSRINPIAGGVCIAASALASAAIPGSGYPLGVLFGIGLLLVERRAPAAKGGGGGGRGGGEGAEKGPWWRSPTLLGQAIKVVAVAHCAFFFTPLPYLVFPGYESTAEFETLDLGSTWSYGGGMLLQEILQRGVIGASEMRGVTGGGLAGPILGLALHLQVGGLWYILGACLEDWANDSARIRTSTAVVGTCLNLALWALMPTGGWPLSAIVFGTAFLGLRKAEQKSE